MTMNRLANRSGTVRSNGQAEPATLCRSLSVPKFMNSINKWAAAGPNLLLRKPRHAAADDDEGATAQAPPHGVPPPTRTGLGDETSSADRGGAAAAAAAAVAPRSTKATTTSSPPPVVFGELDRFISNNNTYAGAREGCLGEVVLSIPNKSTLVVCDDFGWEHHCDSKGNGNDDHEDSDSDDYDETSSAISEVTLMTFRAEMMKKALLLEYKKRKEAEYREDQRRIEGLITKIHTTPRGGAGEEEEDLPLIMPSPNRQKHHPLMSRTVSMPDFDHVHHLHLQATPPARAKSKKKTDTRPEAIDEGEDEYSESDIAHKRGELAVEFGLRPLHDGSDSNNRVIVESTNGDEIVDQKHIEWPPATIGTDDPQAAVAGSGGDREWYLDSIIDLKLQLAQKQSAIDELSSRYNRRVSDESRAAVENADLHQENDGLRNRIADLQNVLNCNRTTLVAKPAIDRSGSCSTATTAAGSTTFIS